MPSKKLLISITLNSNQKKTTLLLLAMDRASSTTALDIEESLLKAAVNKLKFHLKKGIESGKRRIRFFIHLKGKMKANTAFEVMAGDLDFLLDYLQLEDNNHQDLDLDQQHPQRQQEIEILLSKGEEYVGTIVPRPSRSRSTASLSSPTIHILATKSHIDPQALTQIQTTLDKCPGIFMAAGMPDLHPGNPYPIGVAFISRGDWIYPALVGSDIGCGMSLIQMNALDGSSVSLQTDKIKKKLVGLEGRYEGWKEYCREKGVDAVDGSCVGGDVEWTDQMKDDEIVGGQMGTIGGGNHFVEMVVVEEIVNELLLPEGFDATRAFMLVHSGSRKLGHQVLEAFRKGQKEMAAQRGGGGGKGEGDEEGVDVNSVLGQEYLKRHDYACAWAKANRALISQRFHACLDIPVETSRTVLDIFHNRVKETPSSRFKAFQDDDDDDDGVGGIGTSSSDRVWIHRKGAAPSDEGYVVIPGSRGAYSYLVLPKNVHNQDSSHWKSGYSLAHGAGRKLHRSKAKAKVLAKVGSNPSDILSTRFSSAVICEDVNLAAEEHQDAYKEIEDVVSDLAEEAGLIDIVVKFRPLVTYKMRKE